MKKTIKRAVSLLLSVAMMSSLAAFDVSADDNVIDNGAELSQSELAAIFAQNVSVGSSDIMRVEPGEIDLSHIDEEIDISEVPSNYKSYYGGANSYNFYNILADDEKVIYNTIGAALEENINVTTITVAGVSLTYANASAKLSQAYNAFVFDHPEYFHLWSWKDASLLSNGIKFNIDPCAGQSNEGMSTNYKKVMDIVKKKVDSLSSLDTYNKLLELSHYLCDNVVYNTPASKISDVSECSKYPNSWNAYGAFINGSCVCEGYAEAFKMFCDYAKIPCILVISDTHEFNYVNMDGKWYLIDTTWMDTTIDGHYCDPSDEIYGKYANWFLVGSTTTYTQDPDIHHRPIYTGLLGYSTLKYPEFSKDDYEYYDEIEEIIDAPVINDTVMGSTGMYVYWSSVADATSYRIYRADSATGTKTQLGVTGSTNYCDTTAVKGKTYYYYVAAYNKNTKCLSDYSDGRKVVANVLTAPGLTDSAIGDAGLYLYWNSVSGATSYRVYRADSESGTKKQLTVTASTSFVDKTAVSGKTYYYYVAAFNKNTNIRSAYSSARKVTMTKISTPSLTDTCIGDAGLYLYWSSVPGATSYRIYRADSLTGAKTQVLVTANLNGVDTTAVSGKTYYYFVAAFNNKTMIRSAYSSARKVTMTKISTPSLQSVSKTTNGVALSWNTVSGATSYRIYRADSLTGAKTQLAVKAGNTYTDTSVVSGKTYYYFIAAFNNQTMIRSAMSSSMSITA